MQHYGLPTRLLDWTESPLVALFFAIQNPTSDAALYSLDSGKMNSVIPDNVIPILGKSTMDEVREICGRAFSYGTIGKYPPIAVQAPQNDFRMLNQMSCFTLHDIRQPLENVDNNTSYLTKYRILKESLSNIKGELNILGIRRSILFPDLDNLAQELKELTLIPS